MSDDDLERRLDALLRGRADRVGDAARTDLDGPVLRARSDLRLRSTRRTMAQSLVAAAAVAVIAVATQLIPRDHHRPAPAPVQPGGNTPATQVAPPASSAPHGSTTPVRRPSLPADPSPVSSTVPSRPRVSARPTGPPVRSSVGSTTPTLAPPPPPRAGTPSSVSRPATAARSVMSSPTATSPGAVTSVRVRRSP